MPRLKESAHCRWRWRRNEVVSHSPWRRRGPVQVGHPAAPSTAHAGVPRHVVDVLVEWGAAAAAAAVVVRRHLLVMVSGTADAPAPAAVVSTDPSEQITIFQ